MGSFTMPLSSVLTHWTFEPWVIVLLLVSAGMYALGVARLWRHTGPRRGVGTRQVIAFAGGWLTLVLALVSPLDAMGDLLFSAHMVEHELLMLVAAPLLVVARPLGAWSWALSPGGRRAAGRFFHSPAWRAFWRLVTGPLAAWSLHALAIWLWHMPAFFDAALASEGIHALQHASFFLTALLFWWAVLGIDARNRHGFGAALLSLFTTMLHTGALGALLALAPTPWYASSAASTGLLGLDPVADQQLGGIIMWVPGSLAYLVVGLMIAARFLTAAAPARRSSSAMRPAPPSPAGR